MFDVYKYLTEVKGLEHEEAEIKAFYATNVIIMAEVISFVLILFGILGFIKEASLVLLFMIPTRTYFGGIHLDTASKCMIVTSGFIGAIIGLSRYYPMIDSNFRSLTFILFVIAIHTYLPRGTYLKPIDEDDIFKYRVISCFIIVISAIIVKEAPQWIGQLLIYTIMFSMIMAMPVVYKIFNVKEKRD